MGRLSLLEWQQTDKKMLNRVNNLIKDIQHNPHSGICKRQPLKHGLPEYWSRRIDDEHRILYKIENDTLLLVQIRYHY